MQLMSIPRHPSKLGERHFVLAKLSEKHCVFARFSHQNERSPSCNVVIWCALFCNAHRLPWYHSSLHGELASLSSTLARRSMK